MAVFMADIHPLSRLNMALNSHDRFITVSRTQGFRSSNDEKGPTLATMSEAKKSSHLHQAFCDLYSERWQEAGGTLMAFSECCGVRRETLRGWLAKDRLELLENLETALEALGAEVKVVVKRKPKAQPMDRRRTTLG